MPAHVIANSSFFARARRSSPGSLVCLGLVLLSLTLAGCQAIYAPPPLPPGALATRVLFIGNSLTYSNDLPGLMPQLTAREPKPLLTDSVTVPLASLGFHWATGSAAKKIQSGHWDIVVLQEYSSLPASDPEATLTHFQEFAALARQSGARVIIFENWTTRAHSQDAAAMTKTYAQAREQTGATLAPIGSAWRKCQEMNPHIPLLQDDRHPTVAGTYLTALVLYRVIYAHPATGLPKSLKGLQISPETAASLQRVADALPN